MQGNGIFKFFLRIDLGILRQIIGKDTVYKFGLMVANIVDIGKMIKQTEKAV